MRILHVAESVKGGVASYFEEIDAHQQRHFGADNVRYLIPHQQRDELSFVGDSRLSLVDYCRDLRSYPRFSRAFSAELQRFQPDVVHLHSSFAGALCRVPLMLRAQRPHIVYCPHGWAMLRDGAQWKAQVFLGIEKLLCARTDVIIDVSKHELRESNRMGMPANLSELVYSGITPKRAPLVRADEASDKPVRLLFVGRFDRQKGVDLLLEAMRQIRRSDLSVVIAGGYVVDENAGLDFSDPRFELQGWLPRDQIYNLYQDCDAVIMPSRWEGFGLVAIEAMSQAVPVLVSNRGALPEIIEHGHTGMVFNIEQVTELARMIEGLDRATLRRLGQNAKQRFDERFVADEMNRKLVTIYEDLCS